MKYKLMEQVYTIGDTLNFGFPVFEHGYVIAYNFDIKKAFSYYIRFPQKKENWWIPDCDLISSEEILNDEVEEIANRSIINYALDTKNKQIFDSQTKKFN